MADFEKSTSTHSSRLTQQKDSIGIEVDTSWLAQNDRLLAYWKYSGKKMRIDLSSVYGGRKQLEVIFT